MSLLPSEIFIPPYRRTQKPLRSFDPPFNASFSAPTTRHAGHIAIMGKIRAVESEPCTRRNSHTRSTHLRTSSPSDRDSSRTPMSILREHWYQKELMEAMCKKSCSTDYTDAEGFLESTSDCGK